jgi:hypothetical protein
VLEVYETRGSLQNAGLIDKGGAACHGPGGSSPRTQGPAGR